MCRKQPGHSPVALSEATPKTGGKEWKKSTAQQKISGLWSVVKADSMDIQIHRIQKKLMLGHWFPINFPMDSSVLDLLVAALDEDLQSLSGAIAHHSTACHAWEDRYAPVSSSAQPTQPIINDKYPSCCDDQTQVLEWCARPPPVERSSPVRKQHITSNNWKMWSLQLLEFIISSCSLFPKLQPTVRTMAHSTWLPTKAPVLPSCFTVWQVANASKTSLNKKNVSLICGEKGTRLMPLKHTNRLVQKGGWQFEPGDWPLPAFGVWVSVLLPYSISK